MVDPLSDLLWNSRPVIKPPEDKRIEISSCPFCGKLPHVSICVAYAVIHCECGARSRENREGTNTKERVITLSKEWNRRNYQESSFKYDYEE